ncbi:TonB-dependent siderophore receptor [Actomonas aquatica]|uniref:TonB-dependent receptor n=1 Tax=Actomonas aquatica TaxID=2866162 RepID=A0ABZ1C9F2_9BACT|nr:TonB-dependent receptor [Opitutus sp. WL0086]WRQ87848.1 TonB-dependent receptor [Opitutus sp. WL0086]
MKLISPILRGVAVLAVLPAAFSQTTEEDNDVIELAEFTVDADLATGYRATTSLTATGIGAKIMDTPIAINVLTEDFMKDTATTELREALQFVPGVGTSPRNESEFTLRGFSGNISYRNGQYRRQNYTSWNAQRVEVLKGPAAIFFGTVRPGGAINYVTTRPKLGESFTDVQAAVGSEDYYKAGFFTNVPVGDNLAFRFGAGGLDSLGKAMFDYRKESYLGASMLWAITPNQQLIVDLETVHRNNYMQSSRGYAVSHSDYLFNPAVPAGMTVRAWLDSQGRTDEPTYNIYAPIFGADDPYGRFYGYSEDSFEKFISRTVDVEYLARIGDSLVWQTQLNYGYDEQPGMRSNYGDTTPFADGTVNLAFERWNNIRDSYNAKTKLTWRYHLGETSHTLQAGYEFQDVIFNKPGYYDPASQRYNGSLRGVDIIGFDPSSDPQPSGEATIQASGQTFDITRKITETNEAYFIVNQSRFFDERLHALYGARNNMLSRKVAYTRPVTNADSGLGSPEGWTPQYGALFKPRPDLSFFAVYSESIEPNYAIDADGNTALPIETEGMDFGIKSELLDGRLAGTFTYYTLDRGNVAARDTDREIATGNSPYYIFGNTSSSEGIELELNMAPTDNLQLVFGWSHMFEAEVTESTDPARIGQALNYTPDDKVSVWSRYSFDTGSLKGLTVGLGGRYSAAARMTGDPNRVMVEPSFYVMDLMLSYNPKIFGQEVRTQLNVKNLFDNDYREGPQGMFGPPRSIILSMSTRF